MKITILKLADIFIGKLLCLFIGFFDYLFNWTDKQPLVGQPKKILVIRPGGMGDFLYLLPTLQALKEKFPAAMIDVLAEKRNKAVKQFSNAINDLLLYDSNPFKTVGALWSGRYDLVIDSEQFHNFSAIFAYFTRSKIRIGFKTNPFRNHLYTHLIDYSLKGQEAGEFLRLLAPLGIKVDRIDWEKVIDREKIKSAPLPAGVSGRTAIVAPRGEARYRYWALEKYQALINYLQERPGINVVLIGGKAEVAFNQRIKGNLLDLTGQTSLLQLAHLLLTSELFVGCDSGIAILTQVLGVKSITLFGSTDEAKWALNDDKHKIARIELPCSPCYMLGNYKFCKKIDCMDKLSAADVIRAIDKLNTLR